MMLSYPTAICVQGVRDVLQGTSLIKRTYHGGGAARQTAGWRFVYLMMGTQTAPVPASRVTANPSSEDKALQTIHLS